MNEQNNALSLYSIAGQSRNLLFIFLIEKNQNGFFLYRVDTLDQSIMSETWYASQQEAMEEAAAEVPGQVLEWNEIPERSYASIQYIFDHEPRLTIVPLAKVQKETVPLAISWIWLDFAVTSLISALDGLSKGPGPASPIVSLLSSDAASPWAMIIFMMAINFVFTLFMVYKISDGAKWGRNTYALSCLLTIVPMIVGLGRIFADSKLMGLLSLCQMVIELYAMRLLYSPSAQKWFKKR